MNLGLIFCGGVKMFRSSVVVKKFLPPRRTLLMITLLLILCVTVFSTTLHTVTIDPLKVEENQRVTYNIQISSLSTDINFVEITMPTNGSIPHQFSNGVCEKPPRNWELVSSGSFRCEYSTSLSPISMGNSLSFFVTTTASDLNTEEETELYGGTPYQFGIITAQFDGVGNVISGRVYNSTFRIDVIDYDVIGHQKQEFLFNVFIVVCCLIVLIGGLFWFGVKK